MKKARILVGLWMGLACAQVQAANVWWDVCDGNWFVPGNWAPPHVPVAADTVYIDNGCGGPLIQQGNAVGGIVYVGFDTAGNTLEQRGFQANSLTVTELHLGESEGSGGTYKLSGVGQLTATREFIGRNGNGAFTQSGGRNQVTGSIYLGYSPTSSGTYELSGGQIVTGDALYYGDQGGSGLFHQTSGTVSFGNSVVVRGNNSRYELGGTGILTATNDLQVSSSPLGIPQTVEANRFIQTGGSATFGRYLWVIVGTGGGPPGSYEMSGGQLTVGSSTNGQFRVAGGCEGCPEGVARFIQSGGTVNIQSITGNEQGLMIGYNLDGRYELSGTGQLTAPMETLAYTSKGAFIQSGGRNAVTGTLSVGYRDYCYGTNPRAPSIARYELAGNAELQAGEEIVGRGGECSESRGDFIQTGGTNTVQSFLYLGYMPGLTGRYEIGGGTLTALKLWVGYQGNGEFYQTNGTVTADNLDLGRESGSIGLAELSGTGVMAIGAVSVARTGAGTFTLNGGTLTADTLIVGRFSGTGGLEILDPSAQITIGKEFTLGAKALFGAEPGSAIHMTHDAGGTVAAKFDNFRKVSSNVAGLANLELSFEGGADLTATAELAGRDLGAVEAGFVNNFALGTLRVGTPGTSAYVRLVDANDNGNRIPAGTPEALYVNGIIVGPGSTLDLNGLHVYYHYLCNEGGTIDLQGGMLEQVEAAATGDFDYDGVIDLDDFAALSDCMGGAGAPPDPQWVECAQACLNAFDFDDDADVDLHDFSVFEVNFTGP